MGKLIKLEWEKYEIGKYIRNAVILIVLLVIFNYAMTFLGIANDPDTGVPDMAFSNMGVSTNVELLTDITFLIFAAAMHATFIIGAYKNKTMNLMFLYPLNRKKIMAAKMLAVCIFCFAGIVIAKLACYGVSNLGFMMGQKASFPMDYNMLSVSFYIQLLIRSAATISISLLALLIGMIAKSSKVTVISSFLLIILMQGNVGGATLKDNLAVPIVLLAISVLAAILMVQRVEKKDVM
ncbi:ABC transporter permease [Clostridium sp. SL.3.18]|nr:ABC transporter permease [Clostridium sp. SL.3.18]